MIPLPQLFETMYATRVDGIRHYDRHERRLAASARELGFQVENTFDEIVKIHIEEDLGGWFAA